MDIWRELSIAPTSDARAVRRAYARRLKEVHPEDDPEGFERLRRAYELAMRWAEQARAREEADEPLGQDEERVGEDEQATDARSGSEADAEVASVAHPEPPLLEPRESPRGVDLARSVWDALRHEGEQSALARWRVVRALPELAQLDVATELEAAMLSYFRSAHEVPTALLSACDAHYRWQDQVRVTIAAKYSDVEHVIGRLRGAHLKAWLAQLAAQPTHPRLQRAAAKLLVAPYDERGCARFLRNPWKRRALFQLVDQLQREQPEALELAIDRRTLHEIATRRSTSMAAIVHYLKWGLLGTVLTAIVAFPAWNVANVPVSAKHTGTVLTIAGGTTLALAGAYLSSRLRGLWYRLGWHERWAKWRGFLWPASVVALLGVSGFSDDHGWLPASLGFILLLALDGLSRLVVLLLLGLMARDTLTAVLQGLGVSPITLGEHFSPFVILPFLLWEGLDAALRRIPASARFRSRLVGFVGQALAMACAYGLLSVTCAVLTHDDSVSLGFWSWLGAGFLVAFSFWLARVEGFGRPTWRELS
jgi:hypothetical protein